MFQVFGIVSNTEVPMMVLEFLDKGDLKSLLLDSGNSMTCDHLVTICENVSREFGLQFGLSFVHIIFPSDCLRNEGSGEPANRPQGFGR